MPDHRSSDPLVDLLCAVRLRHLSPARAAEVWQSWDGAGGASLLDLLEGRGWITADQRAEIAAVRPSREQEPETGAETVATLRWDGDGDDDAATVAADGGDGAAAEGLPAEERDLPCRLPLQRADQYRTGSLLGTGGQARVLLARDLFIGRDVALKELRRPRTPTPQGDDDATATVPAVRFLREARITGQLEHPNIVPVYELGRRADGTPYYTMRLVRGRTLAEALRSCRDTADRMSLLSHVLDLCHAIAYAHDRGVIHRDIKPANVMVGEFGETVLLDWGVAKVRGGDDAPDADLARGLDLLRADADQRTVDGAAVGTPSYMSPEQATGDLAAVDHRTDIWGLGAVLYQLLTGRPPHTGSTPLQILYRVSRQPVRPVREVEPDAPPELAAIADKALRRERDRRYGSALDLAADLRAYMTGARVTAYDYSSWDLARRFSRQHRGALATAAAVLLTILVALAIVTVAYRNERAARAVAERARIAERAERLGASYHLAQAYLEKADRLATDRESVSEAVLAAAVLRDDPAHPRSPLYDPGFANRFPDAALLRARALSRLAALRRAPGLTLSHAAVATYALARVAYAPDGNHLATGTNGGHLLLWPGAGDAEPEVLFLSRAKGLWGVAYAPDGSRLATGSQDGRLFLLDAAGRLLAAVQAHAAAVWGVAFSPDGHTLATASSDGTVGLWALGPGGDDPRLLQRLTGSGGWMMEVQYVPDGSFLAATDNGGALLQWRLRSDGTAVPGSMTRAADGSLAGALAFDHDGRWLACGGRDGTLTLREPGSGRTLLRVDAHDGGILGLAASPHGDLLASAGADERIRLWRIGDQGRSAVLELTHRGHDDRVSGVAFSPDGSELASVCRDGTLRRWHLLPAAPPLELRGHADRVFALASSADGRRLISCSGDGTARVWDADGGVVLHELRGHTNRVYTVALSPDESLVATAGRDHTVRLWSAATGRELATLEGHTHNVWALAFSPDGRTLASGGHDKRLLLWDLETVAGGGGDSTPESRTLAVGEPGVDNFLWDVAFSPDGALLASTGGREFAVDLIDVATGAVVRSFTGHESWPRAVAFSPDGRLLVAPAADGVTLIWEVATGAVTARLEGHDQCVNQAVFSRDGSQILTVGDDAAAIVWDARSARPQLVLALRSEGYDGLFSPAGDALWIADGSEIHRLPLDWSFRDADPAALLRDAEAAAGQHLDGFDLVPTHPPLTVDIPPWNEEGR